MSCDYKCKVAGLAVGVSGEAVGAVFHGNPDAEIAKEQGTKVYRYRNVAEVMQALGQADTPAPVRLELLRNLAMNKVAANKLKGLSKEETAFYKRQQAAQTLLRLSLGKPDSATDPRTETVLILRGENGKAKVTAALLKAGIGEFPNLDALFLEHNQLGELPDEVANLQSLTKIGLMGNNLTRVPPALLQITGLQMIDLGHNDIAELPPEVGNWVNLTDIGLAGNKRLKRLPPTVASWQELKQIMAGDSIEEFPPEVGEWRKMKLFDGTGGKFTTLPKEIENWKEAEYLVLRGGMVTHLPAEISNIKRWQSIDLRDNPLTEIPQIEAEPTDSDVSRHLYLDGTGIGV
jgi:Leucine-rich repeat (LRR) protein